MGKRKRCSKSDVEQNICKSKLKALETEENRANNDRLSQEEKKQLLEAYNQRGFQVFQDFKLMRQYLPNRCEGDLKIFVERLKLSAQQSGDDSSSKSQNPLLEWQNLCNKLMRNYARDKKTNLDNSISDALMAEVEAMKLQEQQRDPDNTTSTNPSSDSEEQVDYHELLASFAQLLAGKFPDTMKPANALVSMKLFDDLIKILDDVDLSEYQQLEDGSWLANALERHKQSQQSACEGLKELGQRLQNCPSKADLERNTKIEALCLELPKIKRFIDVLNPLQIDESLAKNLIHNRGF